jgi:hypothetical protein
MSLADPQILIGSAVERERHRILSPVVHPDPGIFLSLVGTCSGCKKRHEYRTTPRQWNHCFNEWRLKHSGPQCRIEFFSPQRYVPKRLPKELERIYAEANEAPWWLRHEHFSPNADVKLAHGASAAFTFGFENLASSATYVAGRESTAVSNTSNLYLDYFIGGKATAGTSPTAARVMLFFAYGSVNDTPLYVDVLDGTDSAETITSTDILNAAVKKIMQTGTSNTSDRVYWFSPTSLGEVYGWILPKNFGLYGAHDTGVNTNTTASNHAFYYTGVYMTVV